MKYLLTFILCLFMFMGIQNSKAQSGADITECVVKWTHNGLDELGAPTVLSRFIITLLTGEFGDFHRNQLNMQIPSVARQADITLFVQDLIDFKAWITVQAVDVNERLSEETDPVPIFQASAPPSKPGDVTVETTF